MGGKLSTYSPRGPKKLQLPSPGAGEAPISAPSNVTLPCLPTPSPSEPHALSWDLRGDLGLSPASVTAQVALQARARGTLAVLCGALNLQPGLALALARRAVSSSLRGSPQEQKCGGGKRRQCELLPGPWRVTLPPLPHCQISGPGRALPVVWMAWPRTLAVVGVRRIRPAPHKAAGQSPPSATACPCVSPTSGTGTGVTVNRRCRDYLRPFLKINITFAFSNPFILLQFSITFQK